MAFIIKRVEFGGNLREIHLDHVNFEEILGKIQKYPSSFPPSWSTVNGQMFIVDFFLWFNFGGIYI